MTDCKLVIRHQSRPVRCEICHQADQFEAETGICQRCAELPENLVSLTPEHTRRSVSKHPLATSPTSLIGATTAFFLGTGATALLSAGVGILGLRLVWTENPWLMALGGFLMSLAALVGFVSASGFIFTLFFGMMTMANATSSGVVRLAHLNREKHLPS
ncbi:MAG: ABC transporter permease [Blastocatellia bacterium]|nr:ABC transporter permease [Blastocatellia bacterium]